MRTKNSLRKNGRTKFVSHQQNAFSGEYKRETNTNP